MVDTNMTVEDRLAERLKSAEFAAWFGDEDLRELVVKALDKAFFAEKSNPARTHYNNEPYTVPGPLVQHAFNALDGIIKEQVTAIVKVKLTEEPERLDSIIKAVMSQSIEQMLQKALAGMLGNVFHNAMFDIEQRIRTSLSQR